MACRYAIHYRMNGRAQEPYICEADTPEDAEEALIGFLAQSHSIGELATVRILYTFQEAA